VSCATTEGAGRVPHPDAPGIAASRGRTARAAGHPPHVGPCRSAVRPGLGARGRRCAAL